VLRQCDTGADFTEDLRAMSQSEVSAYLGTPVGFSHLPFGIQPFDWGAHRGGRLAVTVSISLKDAPA
jgi:hypothetical protein